MIFKRKSVFTGVLNEMDINITQADIDAWQNGNMLIQDALPTLTASEREFLMTGTTDEEWDKMLGEPED